MMKFYIGRSGTGKTEAVYKEIQSYMTERPPGEGILIVPEQYSLQVEMALSNQSADEELHATTASPIESELLKRHGGRGFAGFTVTSFRRLIEKVLRETGKPDLMPIDDIGKAMLVKKLFLEHQSELEVFKGIHEKPGFIALFSSFIGELKQFGISADTLSQFSSGSNEATNAKLRDTIKIYNAFQAFAKDKYLDYEDLYIAMAEAVEKSEFLKGAHIWIDGFYFFNALEQNILLEMTKRCQMVTLTLTMDPEMAKTKGLDEQNKETQLKNTADDDVFWAPQDAYLSLIEKLEGFYSHQTASEILLTKTFEFNDDFVNDENKKIENKEIENKKASSLLHLEQELFVYPGKIYNEDASDISMNACESAFWEVEAAVRQLLIYAKEKHYQWSEMAIVHNSGDLYNSLLKQSLQEYDIPFYMDQRRSVMNNPLMRYTIGLLDSILKGYRHDDVFKMLKTELCGLTVEEWEMLELFVVEKGVKGTRWRKNWVPERIKDLKEQGGDIPDKVVVEMERYYKMEALRVRLWESWGSIAEAFKVCETVHDYCLALYNHLHEGGIEERLQAWLDEFKEREEFEFYNEQSQCWNALMTVLDQMNSVSGDQKCALKAFSDMLTTGLSLCDIGVLPAKANSVIVGTLDRTKSHEVKALLLLGLNDGVIPSMKDGSGILTDDEKQLLRSAGLALKSDGDLMAKNELFSLYQMLCRPTEALYLSYSLQEASGKPLRPSTYVERFKRLYPKMTKTTFNSTTTPTPLWLHPRGSLKYLVKGMREMVETHHVEPLWIDALNYYSHMSEEWQHTAKSIAQGLYHTNQVRQIDSYLSHQLFGNTIHASVTRLEAYRACPFSHFVKYGLRPKENKTYEVALPDLGSLFHDAVEKFAVTALFEGQKPLSELSGPDIEKLLDQSVDRSLENPQYEAFLSDHRSQYMLTKLRRTGKRAAKLLVSHLKVGSFSPFAFEVDFKSGGGNDRLPAMLIELSDGTQVLLEGRIDRIDVLDEGNSRYVKIIDYKSGSRPYHIGDIFSGLQMQLMVYMDAVLEQSSHFKQFQEGTPEAKIYPAGLFYFRIDDPLVSGEEMTPEAIEKKIAEALKLDGLVVGGVEMAMKMDVSLEEENKSDVIPFSLKADGSPAKAASCLDIETFNALRKHVKALLTKICEDMVQGRVAIEPYRCGGATACDYCEYKGICQFDLQFKDNAFENVYRLNQEAVVEKLMEKEGVTNNG